MTRVFEKSSVIDAPASVVFAFHERPGALEKLIPKSQPVRVIQHTGGIRDGALVVIEIGIRPFVITWVARHQHYVAGRRFQDVQERGPFRSWIHTHTVTPDGPARCVLTDHVEYEAPGGWLGNWLARLILERTFAFRHAVTIRETAGKPAALPS